MYMQIEDVGYNLAWIWRN